MTGRSADSTQQGYGAVIGSVGCMPVHFNTIVIDAHDPSALAEFWAAALDWVVVGEHEDEVLVAASAGRPSGPSPVPLLFGRNDDAKTTKNRLHFDLVPQDQAIEVERLEALGASRLDIGQGDVSWVVMADPEGNEFCVLRSYEGPWPTG